MSQLQTLEEAARLLVDIAGPEPVHIEMSACGPRKYYDVHRALTKGDARAHLAGYSTRGATLRHPQGMTRALCYDADTPGDWLRLVEAAYWLAAGGYRPLLEESPVGRGGHLWIIYTALVKANRARRHAAEIASSLKEIRESWPGATGHKVRLPGGLYVRPGVRAWCKLYDAQGRLLSADGQEAARVLPDWHTSAELVPNDADAEHEHETSEHAASGNALPGYRTPPMPATPDQDEPPSQDHSTRGADRRWHEKYGRYCWFQFTPDQLAAWYNARTRVQDVLPPGKNGMGLASWRGERTASIGLREGGWVDFGASARRADGKQDGGDALELVVRLAEQPKPEVIRTVAQQLVREAREAMERAAWHGEEPPEWVIAMMTEAGWERYRALQAEASAVGQAQAAPEEDQVPQPTGGVVGFYPSSQTAQGDTQQPGEEVRQCHKTSSAVPGEANRRRETPEALAAAMGMELGIPCPRCGCPLRYPLEPYLMCYKCHPPRGLADDHWRRLCALFPLRPTLQGRRSNA